MSEVNKFRAVEVDACPASGEPNGRLRLEMMDGLDAVYIIFKEQTVCWVTRAEWLSMASALNVEPIK